MKKIGKKTLKTLALSMVAIGAISTTTTFASDDNIDYSFSIKSYYDNSYSAERYRQTSNKDNKWKVDLQYSSEGNGTITTFWLDKSGTRVSESHNVTQGTGAHYYSAYSTANQSNVRLGAENNNYSANTYTVSGKWDEETN